MSTPGSSARIVPLPWATVGQGIAGAIGFGNPSCALGEKHCAAGAGTGASTGAGTVPRVSSPLAPASGSSVSDPLVPTVHRGRELCKGQEAGRQAGWGGEIPVSCPDPLRPSLPSPGLCVQQAPSSEVVVSGQSLFGLWLLTPEPPPPYLPPKKSSQRPKTGGKPGAGARLGQG